LTERARKLEDAAKAADGEAARLALHDLQAMTCAIIAGRAMGTASEGKRQ